MAMSLNYGVFIFAILILIVSILTATYFGILAWQFFELSNLKPPTTTGSTWYVAVNIIMSIMFLVIAVYSLYEIITFEKIQKVLLQKQKSKNINIDVDTDTEGITKTTPPTDIYV